MQKKILIIVFILLLITVSISGCTEVNRAASDTGTCCVVGVIGVILFIILIAYLLGGKKTVVQTQQYAPPSPPIIIEQKPSPPTETHSKTKPDRRCPECGRVIPEDAKICPYCGKKFKLFFNEKDDEGKSKIRVEKKGKVKLYYPIKKEEKCSKCGYKFEEEDIDFCPECGVKLK